ncbi:MAG: ABC transporter [Actinomycetes bacterium]
MKAQEDDVAALLPMLTGLRDEAAATRFPLATPGSAEARRTQDLLVRQVGTYLVPRLETLDAPALVVLGGPTGGGKSTLVNTLAGRAVSQVGVLRPTTRTPVLLCHPDDAAAFTDDRVLPSLRRTEEPTPDPRTVHVATSPQVPAGVALLDAPDLDSVVEDNRALARELLDAADIWLFVLSATRYADAVPWDVLHTARRRGTSVALLLSRVNEGAVDEVTADLARILAERGPGHTPMFVVPECEPADGLLPEDEIALVRGWLDHLADDWDTRARLMHHTLIGTLDGLGAQAVQLADEADVQCAEVARLREEAERAYADEVTALHASIREGAGLGGRALTVWRRSPLAGGLENPDSAPRTTLGRLVRSGRRTSSVEELRTVVDEGLSALLRSHADAAAARLTEAWQRAPAGTGLLATTQSDLSQSSAGLHREVDRALEEWHRWLVGLVGRQGGGRRTARHHPVEPEGLALACAVALLAPPGTADAHRLVRGVLGQEQADALTTQARDDLFRRLEDMLVAERARFTGLLDQVELDPQSGEALRAALAYVERVR